MRKTKAQEMLEMRDTIEQLKALNEDQARRIEELTKEVAKQKASSESWFKMYNDVGNKLNDIAEFVNALPGVLPELKEDGYTRVPLVVRLSVWLATNNTK